MEGSVGGGVSVGVMHDLSSMMDVVARVMIDIKVVGTAAPVGDVAVHSEGILGSVGCGHLVVVGIHVHRVEARVQVERILHRQHRVAGIPGTERSKDTEGLVVGAVGNQGAELVGIESFVADTGLREPYGVEVTDEGVESEVECFNVQDFVSSGGARRNDRHVQGVLIHSIEIWVSRSTAIHAPAWRAL